MKAHTYLMPAGEYFIGDVSYFLDDTIYKSWSFNHNRKDGLYTDSTGHTFSVFMPGRGNGAYIGSNRFNYDVDENNLGICSMNFGDAKKYTGCGTFHSFKDPILVDWSNYVVTFNSGTWSMNIDTNNNTYLDCEDGYDSWS